MLGLTHLEQLEATQQREKQKTEVLNAWDVQDRQSRVDEMKRIKSLIRTAERPATKTPEPKAGPEIEHQTTHCLDRAKNLVCGKRAEDYGPPSESFARVAEAWQAYVTACSSEQAFNGRDVANMMIIYKVIRDAHKHKDDNMDDIAGYAQVAAWIGTNV